MVCLDPKQLSIIKDSLEDFKISLMKASDEEVDPATIDLYEDTVNALDKTKITIDSLACVILKRR